MRELATCPACGRPARQIRGRCPECGVSRRAGGERFVGGSGGPALSDLVSWGFSGVLGAAAIIFVATLILEESLLVAVLLAAAIVLALGAASWLAGDGWPF